MDSISGKLNDRAAHTRCDHPGSGDDPARAAASIRYRVLGPISASGQHRNLASLGAPKQRAVLAALLLQANHVVTEDRLYNLVWGEEPPRTVRGRLQVYISELRSKLGQDVIVRAANGYCMKVEAGELDLHVFNELLTSAGADIQAGRPHDGARRLRTALSLWNGPALGGVTDSFLEYERPSFDERYLAVLEQLFDAELAAGRHTHVIGELRALTTEHPFRERLIAQLMLALHRSERRPEALRVYAEAHRRLIDELGLEPGKRLREVQLIILNDTDHVPAPEPVEPSNRAVERPVTPTELPRDVPTFRGRATALAALDRRLRHTDGNVAVISGTAGIGKTALAVRWAHSARDHFPDGQLYLNLRGYDPEKQPLSPGEALERLLRSLGAATQDIPAEPQVRASVYRSLLANRRVLLVLDNARDAAQVLPLLPASGSILVTSRYRLPELMVTAGARPVPLSGLDRDEARHMLEAILGAHRIRGEAEAVEQLWRLCDGLPLALRIAAAHIAAQPDLSIAEEVAALNREKPLDALALDGKLPGPVTTAFDATYNTLQPATQRLFRLLGLIPSRDFDSAAVLALADLPEQEVLKQLRALTSVHLVEQEAPDQYRLDTLARAYAFDQARSDPGLEAAWARLTGHYLNIETGETKSVPRQAPRSGTAELSLGEKVRALDPSPVPQLRKASGAVIALRTSSAPLLWLGQGSPGHRDHRLRWPPQPAVTGRELALLSEEPRMTLVPGARDTSALYLCIQRLHNSLREAREVERRECEAVALHHLGSASEAIGQLPEAIGYTRDAVAIFAELGSVIGESQALDALGTRYHHLGKLFEARDCHRQALALGERHDLPLYRAMEQLRIGSVHHALGHHTDAGYNLGRALTTFQALDATDGQALTYYWLSRLRWETDDDHRAYRDARQAVELSRATEVRSAALVALADAEVRLGHHESAEQHIGQLSETTGVQQIYARCALARLQSARDEPKAALATAALARRRALGSQYRMAEIAASLVIAEVADQLGDSTRALRTARDTLALCEQTGAANEAKRVRRLLADLGQ